MGKEVWDQCGGTGQTEVQYLQIVESAECVPELVKFCLPAQEEEGDSSVYVHGLSECCASLLLEAALG